MSGCQRFEQEGLPQLEKGRPLDAHFETCPDCLAARQSYERLTTELSSLDPGAPPAGWEDRVWETIAKKKKKKYWRRPMRAFLLPAFGLAAAAILAVLLLPRALQQPGSPTLLLEFQAGAGPVRRGAVIPDSPVPPGTYVVLNATSPGARYAELRVYRNDNQLLFQASRVAGRAEHGDELQARLVLEVVGRYQAVLFSSRQPIPPPSVSMDQDVVNARQTGANVTLGLPISVR